MTTNSLLEEYLLENIHYSVNGEWSKFYKTETENCQNNITQRYTQKNTNKISFKQTEEPRHLSTEDIKPFKTDNKEVY